RTSRRAVRPSGRPRSPRADRPIACGRIRRDTGSAVPAVRARRTRSSPRRTQERAGPPPSGAGSSAPPRATPSAAPCRGSGRPRVPNEMVAKACREHPKTFVGFGSVDPLKGDIAVGELDHIASLRLKGVKLHPSLQAFQPDDERFWPLYERCEELGLVVLFHTGTSGIGAGQPGGQGIRLDYARPIRLDAVAAAFPSLNVIAAHFGYPWHLELLAMALHKTNIYIDI